MAYVKTDDVHYTGIADAIRSLHDGEETYTPREMGEYLSTEGTALKPWNIAKGVTIFGVTGTLSFDNSNWPSDSPVTEDVIDTAVKKYDVRADVNDKFLLMDDKGNITVGYPLKEIVTNMAFYNGHKLPDIGNANTKFVFRNSSGEYIYYVLEDGCEAYSYFMWSDQYKEYRLTRNQDKAIQWARYKLNSSREWALDDRSNYFGSSLVFVGDVEIIWIGSDIYAEDNTVLHPAGAYTYEREENDLFTITDYDPISTEFCARCWLRAAYHTTGEYAGQVTIDDFVSTASGGYNYICNIRYCSRDALYYEGEIIWQR